jgi:hypothetical protein
MSARVTPAAAAVSAQSAAGDAVEVVLELEPPGAVAEGSRAERIAQQKASFRALAEPVKALVVEAGGSVEAEAWINCTIKARVPAGAIQRLQEIAGVATIDLPHRLEPE